MEQLVIILVIALISLINWAIQKSAEQRERRKQENTSETRRQAVPPAAAPRPEPTVSDQMRKLMEEENTSETRRQAVPPVAAPRPEPTISDQMRKLMEALGLPENVPPPEPKRQERVPPPVVAPPPVRDIERRVTTVESRRQKSLAPVPVVVEPRAPRGAARQDRLKTKVPTPSKPLRSQSRWSRLLASPEGMQSAVVLREVLGKPKGLRMD